MAIIEWQERKETFNPDKNYFEYTSVKVSRETSEEEDRLSRNCERYYGWGATLAAFGTIGGLFGGVALGALELWLAFCIVFSTCIACIIVGSVFLMNKGSKCDEALDRYIKEHDVWTTPEVEAIRQYNKEQQEIADKWRAEHPFEEHIRTCIKDPNSSVAIAVAAKYYAENFLNKETY